MKTALSSVSAFIALTASLCKANQIETELNKAEPEPGTAQPQLVFPISYFEASPYLFAQKRNVFDELINSVCKCPACISCRRGCASFHIGEAKSLFDFNADYF